jgi:hypothetical protein
MFGKERLTIYSNGNGQKTHGFSRNTFTTHCDLEAESKFIKTFMHNDQNILKVTCIIKETGNYYSNSTQKLGSNIQWIPIIWDTSGLEYFEPVKRLSQIYQVARKGLKGKRYVHKTKFKLSVH